MSAISDFAAKQSAYNDKLSSDLDAIAAQITALNTLISTLQSAPGPISPADQATLDQLQTAGTALQTKADAIAATPPPVVPAG